jgi:23S rRNA pseudouridine1911/1915/1917 synthase
MTDPENSSADYNDLSEPRVVLIPPALAGIRFDATLAKLFPEYSRSRLQQWMRDGLVTVNNVPAHAKTKVFGGETVTLEAIPQPEEMAFTAEDIYFPIVFEDDHIMVIDKPAGLVVHPAAGNWSGTLLNGLLHHNPSLATLPRAGIVHRLDKDTSGLMVVAKTLVAQTDLVRQLQAHTVKRHYIAIVDGLVRHDGTIDANIGRDPHNRLKMAVLSFGGKPSVTHLHIIERYLNHTLLECRLETGRTHQIRVHMQKAGHPLAGDPVYGNPRHTMSAEARQAVQLLNRQALHATRLELVHPVTGQTLHWKSRMPVDMRAVLALLSAEAGKTSVLAEDDEDEDDNGWEVIYTRE